MMCIFNRAQVAVHRFCLLGILILITPVFVVIACTPQPADCTREDFFCVGLVTAFDGVDDHGLNQATWETLQNLVSQAQITRLDKIESIDQRDWQKNILFFADNGYDLIVTVGSNMGETMAAVASEYPSAAFIGVDQEFDEEHGNISTIRFPEDQAGFLAGMVAAMISPSGKVGAICETSGIDVVWQYCEGFQAGAIHENEEIDVSVVYRDSGDRNKTFNDPEWGQKEILKLIGEGVDTITGYGGNTAQGAFLTASENGIFVIGSEADLYYRLPALQPVLVTSIIKDPGIELSSLVVSASQGESISGPHTGQISYAPFRIPRFETDLEMRSYIEEALQGIRNGEIEVTLPPKER